MREEPLVNPMYIVVERDVAQELAIAVSHRMRNGYVPHGSMVITENNYGPTKYIYLQPMVLALASPVVETPNKSS